MALISARKASRFSAFCLLLVLASPLLALIVAAALSYIGDIGITAAGDDTLTGGALLYRITQTALYVGGALTLALALAVPAAWAVTSLNFAGRRLAEWELLLPFALPHYITAYVYDDIQRALGWYLPGLLVGVAAAALALYPYIYFLCRAALKARHCHLSSAARLFGCSPLAAFWRVSLPLARPAIAVGMTLVAMETLNDIAVAEHFGIQTLGIGIYDLWLNRSNPAAAARLALALALAALALVGLEAFFRRRQAQYVIACDKCFDCEQSRPLAARQCVGVWMLLLIPPALGFFAPVFYLLHLTTVTPANEWLSPLADGLAGSLLIPAALCALLLTLGLALAIDRRARKYGGLMRALHRLARATYALPGAIIANGVFFLSAGIYALTGWQPLALGGFAALLFACSARFFIIAAGALAAGMDKIAPQLDAAARLMTLTPVACFFRVHLPLLRGAIAATTLLIFLESVKELPLMLILRPFNFNTLSTIVYQYASDEALERAAAPALLLALLATLALTLIFLLEGKADNRGNNAGGAGVKNRA